MKHKNKTPKPKKTDRALPKKPKRGGKKVTAKSAGTGKGKNAFGRGKKLSKRGAKKPKKSD